MVNLFHPKYRPDIDGLRAIAVLSVVFFHAFPRGSKLGHIGQGGFIGVDIFFVISGFLISTIIFNSLETNTFSFRRFYAKRIQRIFPALITILSVSFIFGWFVLFADEYKQLSKHIVGAATYTNNFMFWQENGYFDAAAETKPLLHLWSLSIEEQFYVVWPLLIWFCFKRGFHLLKVICILTIISFALHIYTLYIDKVAAFYSPELRVWELLIGSLVAYTTLEPKNKYQTLVIELNQKINRIFFYKKTQYNKNILKNIQSLIGFVLIFIGITIITKDSYFPGWYALLFPILGTVLIISAGEECWVNKKILSNKVLVWFGLISYPLYLWHWPLLSFAHIVESHLPSGAVRGSAIIVSIILAALTYYFIEKPVRFKKDITLTLICLMIIIASVSYYTFKKNGEHIRGDSNKDYAEALLINNFDLGYKGTCSAITHETYEDDWCNEGTSINRKIKLLIMGDSHSNAFSSMFNAYSKTNSSFPGFIQFGRGECPTLIDYGPEPCKKITNDIFKYINSHQDISTVVLSAKWSFYIEGKNYSGGKYKKSSKESPEAFRFALDKTITKLESMNKKVVVLLEVPHGSEPKSCIPRPLKFQKVSQCNLSLSNALIKNKGSSVYLKNKLDNLHIKYLDPFVYFCDKSTCKTIDNNKILYSDFSHISYFGGEFLAAHAKEELDHLFIK